MAKYCITGAKPKSATHGPKSQFYLWKLEEKEDGSSGASREGWKPAAEIAALLGAGHQVLTAKHDENGISLGAPVEMELRIAKNGTKYKLGDMPDR